MQVLSRKKLWKQSEVVGSAMKYQDGASGSRKVKGERYYW